MEKTLETLEGERVNCFDLREVIEPAIAIFLVQQGR